MTSSSNHALPQLAGGLFITDGGLETDLIFNRRVELPEFSAYPLLDSEEGRGHLSAYFGEFVNLAADTGCGMVIDTVTWCANPDRALPLGYDSRELDRFNREAVSFAREIASTAGGASSVVNGVVGPRGDAYALDTATAADAAEAYHRPQIQAFAAAGADMVTALTMNDLNEATGIVRAACSAGLPVVISFTVETNGALAGGQTLEQAIVAVDAATDSAPAYYMINCAHPDHFASVLRDEAWMSRVRGVRANASRCSHAELDAAEHLDAGNPDELGAQYAELRACFPWINVFGGCCGTDARHLHAIVQALAADDEVEAVGVAR